MKINLIKLPDSHVRQQKKIYLIMKLTWLLILAFCLQSTASVWSQTSSISLKMDQTSLQELFSTIENKTGYRFFYNNDEVDVSQKVTVNVSDKPIGDILTQAFKDLPYSFREVGNKLILVERSANQMGVAGSQQQKSISGKVTDSSGGSLPGVSVVIKGTTNGTITDANGNYSISNVSAQAAIQFSFIGMKMQEIVVGGKATINVTLAEETVGIEEVVAVGYGTQKKVNLTGAIASVSSKELEKRTVTQTSQLLSGLVSGVTISQTSAQPGKDGTDITIRGLGTFSGAGNRPLVLVDGLASSLDNVNVNDIASISVLKDAASASIYGTRAANGVILIETKKGKDGEFRISYQGSVGLQRAAQLPKIVDSWVYAQTYNEALTNVGGSAQYSADEIAKFKSGIDPDNYPNKRHYNDLVSSGSGLQTDHHISFSGGTARSQYMVALGYLDQSGLIAKTNYKRYDMLVNVESKLKENLTLKVKMSGRNGVTNEPTAADKNPALGVTGLLDYAIKIPNTYAGKMSNGYYGNQTGFTIEGWMDSEAFLSNNNTDAIASVSLDWNITKTLKLTGITGYDFGSYTYKMFRPLLVVDQFITQGPSELTEMKTNNKLLTSQLYLNYDFKIQENTFHALLGYSQESYRNEWIQAFRDNFPNNSLYEINAGAASNQQSSGSANEWALRSYFGRINYDYKGKYLLEANARYDGSSRFPVNKRFGLFPSLSGGWRISKEDFFHINWISELKLRASWGKLGNQNIGNYPYQQVLSLGLNAPFGVSESLSSGAAATILPNQDISWESSRVVDGGFDLSLFKNKLNISADYYDKLTTGILYNITASRVLGLTPSIVNAGSVSNKGIDLNIVHNNTLGKFSYSIAGNFSYVKNEVTKLASVIRDINNGLFVGSSLGSIYGYVADGLFADAADVSNSPTQPRTAMPGDIKFLDISGPNGVPDGKVDADYDRKIIGNTFPKYNFGANLNARYKAFDLSVQFSGVAGLDKVITGYEGNAFQHGASPQEWMVKSRWTKDNPNPNAAYPRFLILGGGEQQFWNSTFVLLNAAYLRVNNVQLGYNVPESLVKILKVSNLRFYVGIKNLMTFDHFREGWDPEVNSGYPPVRYFNIGINTNF
jgi:TonB-linked SusC/RagA family outer membrane protein